MQTESLSNHSAEKQVIGLLIDSRESRERLLPVVEHADFSSLAHRKIFHAIHALDKSGFDIDRITVADYLTKSGELNEVGGVSALVSLSEDSAPAPNLESYIRIIKSYRSLRRLHDLSRDLETSVLSQSSPAEIVRDTIGKLEGIERDSSQLDNVPVIADILDALPEGAFSILDPESARTTIATGITELDALTNGFEASSLVIIGARTSCGKTALALSIARNMALNDVPVAVMSIEMTSRSLIERLASMQARVNLLRFRAGRCEEFEQDALKRAIAQVYSMPIYIDECPGLTLADFAAKADRLVRQRGCKVIFVDYVQRMLAPARRKASGYMNTHTILTEIVEAMKALAMRLGVCIVALSQLNRDSDKRRGGDNRPTLSDLRESGSLEESADLVTLIYRESLHKPDREDLKGQADLLVLKQRNGPTGTVQVQFKQAYAEFCD